MQKRRKCRSEGEKRGRAEEKAAETAKNLATRSKQASEPVSEENRASRDESAKKKQSETPTSRSKYATKSFEICYASRNMLQIEVAYLQTGSIFRIKKTVSGWLFFSQASHIMSCCSLTFSFLSALFFLLVCQSVAYGSKNTNTWIRIGYFATKTCI